MPALAPGLSEAWLFGVPPTVVVVSVLLSVVDEVMVDAMVDAMGDDEGREAPRVAAKVTSESVPQHVLLLPQHQVVEFGVPSQGVIWANPPPI